MFDAKLLILDEPTTALNNEEIEHLFCIVRRLRDAGQVVYIHFPQDAGNLRACADRYTVLRNGASCQMRRDCRYRRARPWPG